MTRELPVNGKNNQQVIGHDISSELVIPIGKEILEANGYTDDIIDTLLFTPFSVQINGEQRNQHVDMSLFELRNGRALGFQYARPFIVYIMGINQQGYETGIVIHPLDREGKEKVGALKRLRRSEVKIGDFINPKTEEEDTIAIGGLFIVRYHPQFSSLMKGLMSLSSLTSAVGYGSENPYEEQKEIIQVNAIRMTQSYRYLQSSVGSTVLA
ncbi:MAG TPA: hypothetical protein VGT05_05415 [Patescibacteria group bacterium]|nr:hypothetical protein [Patescibacteria group bacterium]